ncbi:MAG: DHA2 family efflux MFS transporter permease subunit [Ktedonobacterales bacterium]
MQTSTPNAGRPTGATEGDRARLTGWALTGVLASLMLTMLLAALDQTIVSTALPKILDDLNGYSRYTWVVTAYLLAETTVIPVIGKLSDQFGRKWFLVAGVAIFLIGSMLSGTSNSMTQLIAFRGLQGIGAGFIFALVFTLIGDIFTPAERARWQGLFSAVFALASVIGPSLGGWITDNTTWRWVFYVNMPLGVIALALLIFVLPNNLSLRSSAYRGKAALRRIDFAGAISAGAATVCLLLGLTWGGVTYPWNSAQVIGILAAAIIFFAAFFVIERRFAVEPILPLDLFKNKVFAAGALLSLTVGMALYAVVIYLPLFIQAVLGQSATNSGAVITPLTLTLAIGAAVVGQVIYKIGSYQVISIIGGFVLAIGSFLLIQMGPNVALGQVTINMIVVGIGLGMVQPVLTLAVQNAIPRTRLGVGTSAVTYLRTMGQTLGTAIIGAVVTNAAVSALPKHLPAAAQRLPASTLAAATNQQVLTQPHLKSQIVAKAVASIPPGPQHAQAVAQTHTLFNQIFEASRLSLATGIHEAFIGALVIVALAIVVTFFLSDVPLIAAPKAPAAQTPAPGAERITDRTLAGVADGSSAATASEDDYNVPVGH